MCVVKFRVYYFKNMIIGSRNNSQIRGVKKLFFAKMNKKSLKND